MDTSARLSFIRKDVIPNKIWNRIKQSNNNNVRDGNKHKFHNNGTIAVEIVDGVEMINFNVVERPEINALLGAIPLSEVQQFLTGS